MCSWVSRCPKDQSTCTTQLGVLPSCSLEQVELVCLSHRSILAVGKEHQGKHMDEVLRPSQNWFIKSRTFLMTLFWNPQFHLPPIKENATEVSLLGGGGGPGGWDSMTPFCTKSGKQTTQDNTASTNNRTKVHMILYVVNVPAPPSLDGS